MQPQSVMRAHSQERGCSLRSAPKKFLDRAARCDDGFRHSDLAADSSKSAAVVGIRTSKSVWIPSEIPEAMFAQIRRELDCVKYLKNLLHPGTSLIDCALLSTGNCKKDSIIPEPITELPDWAQE